MYQRILVPFDGSPTSLLGLNEAIKLVKLSHGCIRVVYAIDELKEATGFESCAAYTCEVLESLRRTGTKILEQARSQAKASGLAIETRMVESGGRRLEELIIEQASQWGAELIVIGSHGRRGLSRLLMGSDAEKILRTAPVPVLVVRPPAGETYDARQDNLIANT